MGFAELGGMGKPAALLPGTTDEGKLGWLDDLERCIWVAFVERGGGCSAVGVLFPVPDPPRNDPVFFLVKPRRVK